MIQIFISYKEEFAAGASKLAEILKGRGGRGLEVFVASEMAGGSDWFDRIRRELARSNLLLLLYTDPSDDWDWCIYEAGMFTDPRDDSYKRVICLHGENSGPPPQLEHLQAVRADLPGARKFLRELFGATSLTGQRRPLNPAFAKDDTAVESEAKKICRLFNTSNKHRWHYYTKYFRLHVADRKSIQKGTIPNEAKLTSRNSETFRLFDLEDEEDGWRWDEFKAAARETCEECGDDDRWIRELEQAAEAAAKKHVIPQIQATFRGRDGNIYHPILARSDTIPPGTMTFEILLMETVAGGLVAAVPADLGILITGLRAGLRLRYEVLNHIQDLEEQDNTEQEKEIYAVITRAMQSIDNEVRSRGVKATSEGAQVQKENFVAAFSEPDEKRLAAELFESWRRKRKALKTELGSSSIERQKVVTCLRDVEKTSCELMVLASKRYYDLIRGFKPCGDAASGQPKLRRVG